MLQPFDSESSAADAVDVSQSVKDSKKPDKHRNNYFIAKYISICMAIICVILAITSIFILIAFFSCYINKSSYKQDCLYNHPKETPISNYTIENSTVILCNNSISSSNITIDNSTIFLCNGATSYPNITTNITLNNTMEHTVDCRERTDRHYNVCLSWVIPAVIIGGWIFLIIICIVSISTILGGQSGNFDTRTPINPIIMGNGLNSMTTMDIGVVGGGF